MSDLRIIRKRSFYNVPAIKPVADKCPHTYGKESFEKEDNYGLCRRINSDDKSV